MTLVTGDRTSSTDGPCALLRMSRLPLEVPSRGIRIALQFALRADPTH
jgi:hypothetical protein